MKGQILTVSGKKKMKRRNAIEPIIGHLKSDYGMARNYLKGRIGDEINALMASCGYNLKKLLNHMIVFVYILLCIKNPQKRGYSADYWTSMISYNSTSSGISPSFFPSAKVNTRTYQAGAGTFLKMKTLCGTALL